MQFLKSMFVPNSYMSKTVELLQAYLQEGPSKNNNVEVYKAVCCIDFPAIILQSQYNPYSKSSPCPLIANKESSTTPHKTVIRVLNQDCLGVARDIYSSSAKKVSILNCANEYNCGGGFDRCNGSQEEYLFRNTTLLASLWPHRRVDDTRFREVEDLLPRSTEPYYPFSEAGGIYSPHVVVHSVMDTPLLSEEYFPCSVLTIAAQDLRMWRGNIEFDFELTRQKFRTLFHMAQANGEKILVLTSIGCGAFLNDPVEIAKAFRSLLCDGGEFSEVFDEVYFALIKSVRNFEVFQGTFNPTLL